MVELVTIGSGVDGEKLEARVVKGNGVDVVCKHCKVPAKLVAALTTVEENVTDEQDDLRSNSDENLATRRVAGVIKVRSPVLPLQALIT